MMRKVFVFLLSASAVYLALEAAPIAAQAGDSDVVLTRLK